MLKALSLRYDENHVETLEKQYGQGDHAIVTDDFKAEWSDLRLPLHALS